MQNVYNLDRTNSRKRYMANKSKRPIEIFIKKKYLKKINKGGDMD